jgi:hypothetical protein
MSPSANSDMSSPVFVNANDDGDVDDAGDVDDDANAVEEVINEQLELEDQPLPNGCVAEDMSAPGTAMMRRASGCGRDNSDAATAAANNVEAIFAENKKEMSALVRSLSVSAGGAVLSQNLQGPIRSISRNALARSYSGSCAVEDSPEAWMGGAKKGLGEALYCFSQLLRHELKEAEVLASLMDQGHAAVHDPETINRTEEQMERIATNITQLKAVVDLVNNLKV